MGLLARPSTMLLTPRRYQVVRTLEEAVHWFDLTAPEVVSVRFQDHPAEGLSVLVTYRDGDTMTLVRRQGRWESVTEFQGACHG
jgi:hypothetical protein